MEEIKKTKCPLCNLDQISAKSLGFVKCKWIYRLFFLGKNKSYNTGDGHTLDDNLYILKEIDMKNSIEKLDILIQQKEPKEKSKFFQRRNPNQNESSDYDSYLLECNHPERRKKSKIEFNGYLNSAIDSKLISTEYLNKFGVEMDQKKISCGKCFGFGLDFFKGFFKKK